MFKKRLVGVDACPYSTPQGSHSGNHRISEKWVYSDLSGLFYRLRGAEMVPETQTLQGTAGMSRYTCPPPRPSRGRRWQPRPMRLQDPGPMPGRSTRDPRGGVFCPSPGRFLPNSKMTGRRGQTSVPGFTISSTTPAVGTESQPRVACPGLGLFFFRLPPRARFPHSRMHTRPSSFCFLSSPYFAFFPPRPKSLSARAG